VRSLPLRLRAPALAPLAGLVFLLAGCFTTERAEALADDEGAPVPVRFRHALEVAAPGGEPLADATVCVGNDEDPVVEVGWTNAAGRATLAQEYLEQTVRVSTFRLLGIPLGRQSALRYPGFELQVARAGYFPFTAPLLPIAYGPRPATPVAGERLSPLVVERAVPLAVTLPAAPTAGHPGRRAAALFAAPHTRALKLGARGPVNGGRFIRVGAPGGDAPIACAAQALRREAGGGAWDEVLLVATVEAADRRFYEEAAALAASCDAVVRGAVVAASPETFLAALGAHERTRREGARALATKEEAAPPGDVATLLGEVDAALALRERTAVLAPVATVTKLKRSLEERGFKRIAETWIEAW
jgi:hypothetical protein